MVEITVYGLLNILWETVFKMIVIKSRRLIGLFIQSMHYYLLFISYII